MPNVTTAGFELISSWRLTIVCALVTISAAVTIGSMPFHGVAPWLWRPCTTMWNVSELAIAPPARTADLADVEEADDVHAEHRVRLEILEHAVLDHQRRAAFLAGRCALLRRAGR